jgi:GNAT superfamily N-acetyltransferase
LALTVRASVRDDAEATARLSRRFDDYLRSLGAPDPDGFTAEQYLRDGLGKQSALAGLVAELDGEVVGYLLYHHAHDIDRGGRYLYIFDLFVDEDARRQGVGSALVESASEVCRPAGGAQLFWSVYTPNGVARSFYEGTGASYTKELVYMYRPV